MVKVLNLLIMIMINYKNIPRKYIFYIYRHSSSNQTGRSCHSYKDWIPAYISLWPHFILLRIKLNSYKQEVRTMETVFTEVLKKFGKEVSQGSF